MKLHMRVFKEKREPVGKKPVAQPLAEDISGTVYVGRFMLEKGRCGQQEVCGRDMGELVDRMRERLVLSEPELNGHRISDYAISFKAKTGAATRTLVGPEESFNLRVRRFILEGAEVSDFFRAVERALGSNQA